MPKYFQKESNGLCTPGEQDEGSCPSQGTRAEGAGLNGTFLGLQHWSSVSTGYPVSAGQTEGRSGAAGGRFQPPSLQMCKPLVSRLAQVPPVLSSVCSVCRWNHVPKAAPSVGAQQQSVSYPKSSSLEHKYQNAFNVWWK